MDVLLAQLSRQRMQLSGRAQVNGKRPLSTPSHVARFSLGTLATWVEIDNGYLRKASRF